MNASNEAKASKGEKSVKDEEKAMRVQAGVKKAVRRFNGEFLAEVAKEGHLFKLAACQEIKRRAERRVMRATRARKRAA